MKVIQVNEKGEYVLEANEEDVFFVFSYEEREMVERILLGLHEISDDENGEAIAEILARLSTSVPVGETIQ